MRQRDLRFTFSVLHPEQLEFEVIEFQLEEALSEPFRLTLELAHRKNQLNFGKILDKPALLTIWVGTRAVRHVHGLVSSFTQGVTGFERTRYRAVVEPRLARLQLSSDWRIFQDKSVPDILHEVFKEHGILNYEKNLHAEHLPREYCVQAGDTDLYFLDRLTREEGIVSWFTFDEKDHTPHYTDKLYVQPRITGGPMIFNAQPVGDNPEPVIRSLSYTENVRTAEQVQRDYTFKRPSSNLQQSRISRELQNQGHAYQHYNYPGRYKSSTAGSLFTDDRLRGYRQDARMAVIEGDDPRILPGHSFELAQHPRTDFNTWWRPVRVVHRGVQYTSQEDEAAYAEQGVSYDWVAEIVSEETEWRAEPLPKPCIDGPQIASVVGPHDEEIFVDEWGRVKIQFPWDRLGKNDERSSCWIRVAQNWAGDAWGHMAIPRIGQEVIVSHLDGDCDQPIIIGRTYRATNRPPYALPQHKTRMTIKSKTHKGEGFNELRFEDEKDREEIYVHAQKDQNIHVNHDETTFVGHDRSEQVEHDETISIGHDRKETVGQDERVNIGRDRKHEVGNDDYLVIGRNHSIRTGKDRLEEVGNSRRDKTTANHFIDIGGHKQENIQGRHQIEAAHSIIRRTRRYELRTGESLVISAPGGSITLDSSGITLNGINLLFRGPFNVDGGEGSPFAITGSPATEKPMDRLCGRRPDGTCALTDCACLGGLAK